MKEQSQGGSGFWVGCGVLLLVGIFLALRGTHAVSEILSGKHRQGADPIQLARAWKADAAAVALKDSLLISALPAERDPFRNPPPVKPTSIWKPPSKDPVKKPLEVPTVRAVLYDNVDPSIKLSIGGSTSTWLHKGDHYRGWMVVEITPTATLVAQGDESVVLPSP
jgi:hypothetical protein